MDDYRALLENSYQTTKEFQDGDLTRLEFLADYIFDFTTYDTGMGELFASKAVEVCAAINSGTTLDYIKDEDNYRWYLLMVNMPFFAGRLEWGTSVRGAWWDHGAQKLETCGLWREDEQVLSLELPRSAWMRFIAALVGFAALGVLALHPAADPVVAWVDVRGGEPADVTLDRNKAGRWQATGGDVRELVERAHGVEGRQDDEAFRQHHRDRIAEAHRFDAKQRMCLTCSANHYCPKHNPAPLGVPVAGEVLPKGGDDGR